MLKLFSLLIFVSLSLPGFSQEETVKEALSPHGGQVIIQGNSAPTPDENAAPEAAILNEDADVQELETTRLKQLEKMKVIETTTKPLADPVLNPLEEIQKLGYKQINAAALLDDKVLAIMQKTLKTGVMSKLPAAEVKKMIQEKFKGSMLEGIFNKYPKILDIFVDLMRDKDALAGLLGIMIRKDDLKEYGYICLALLIFGLFVKSRIIKPKWPFFKRFLYSITVSFFLSMISFYLFYSYFGTEIGPTLSVISKHF